MKQECLVTLPEESDGVELLSDGRLLRRLAPYTGNACWLKSWTIKSAMAHGLLIFSADFIDQLNHAHICWPTLSIVCHLLKINYTLIFCTAEWYLYVKFVDVGIFLQRPGKEVCCHSCPGVAHHGSAAVYYQDRRHLFLHLCLGLCSSHISGKRPALCSMLMWFERFLTECWHWNGLTKQMLIICQLWKQVCVTKVEAICSMYGSFCNCCTSHLCSFHHYFRYRK